MYKIHKQVSDIYLLACFCNFTCKNNILWFPERTAPNIFEYE